MYVYIQNNIEKFDYPKYHRLFLYIYIFFDLLYIILILLLVFKNIYLL